MDLPVIEMERPKARKAFLEYRQAFRAAGSELDAELMRGYRELAKGRQVLALTDAMRAGGVDERGLPRLAIARADQDFAHTEQVSHDGSGWVWWGPFSGSTLRWDRRVSEWRWSRSFGPGTFEVPNPYTSSTQEYVAMAPLIPPGLRPPHKLENYHVLWEADWRPHVPPAPRDPALLRHIGGDLYAVLAIWDLTDLERAVLGGR